MANLYKPGRYSAQEPPTKPGEYYWEKKRTGENVYEGTSDNLKRRRGEHERSEKKINRRTHIFKWKQADGRFSTEKRLDHERKRIKQNKPRLNQREGGGGRK
jgi:hypothetical protein